MYLRRYVQSDGTSGLLFVSAAALLKGQELQSPRLWPCSCCSSWWWPVVCRCKCGPRKRKGRFRASLACFTTPVPQPPGPAPRSASCRRSSRLARVVQHSQRSVPRPFCSRREPRGFLTARAQAGIPCRSTLPSLDVFTVRQQGRGLLERSQGWVRPGPPLFLREGL